MFLQTPIFKLPFENNFTATAMVISNKYIWCHSPVSFRVTLVTASASASASASIFGNGTQAFQSFGGMSTFWLDYYWTHPALEIKTTTKHGKLTTDKQTIWELPCSQLPRSVAPNHGEGKVQVGFLFQIKNIPEKNVLCLNFEYFVISCIEAKNTNFQYGGCILDCAGLWGHCTSLWGSYLSS